MENGSNITIMTIYYFPPLDNPRESILIPLFSSTLGTRPLIVAVTLSQETTEVTEIEKNLSLFSRLV
jgi:hypothetical protein